MMVAMSEPVASERLGLPGGADVGEIRAHLVEAREVLRRLDDDRVSARVGEVPLHLSGGGRLVDRHQDAAGEPDREVDEGPLVAGLADEPDLLARLDPRSDEALRQRRHLVEELLRGHVAPAAGLGQGEERAVGSLPDPVEEQGRRVGLRIGGDHQGRIELVHGNSFGT
jgi:hypothetical protein